MLHLLNRNFEATPFAFMSECGVVAGGFIYNYELYVNWLL